MTTDTNRIPLAELRDVTYTHWNQNEPSLRDVSLRLFPGTLNVLVGPSGSGKSTLCDLLNGVVPHLHGGQVQGEVWIDGIDTRQCQVNDLAQKVGRVFQDPETMFATLYVEDEVAFGPENLCLPAGEIRATVEEFLSMTDLQAHRRHLVWQLSGGQVQKLGLAAVMAMRPRLLVLDEPTSNLDPAATYSVHQLVLSLRDQGVTILLVTRELDEFLAEADQLLVLDDGCLTLAGPPRPLLAEHGTYLGQELGVWLPETSEIGLALRDVPPLSRRADWLPITVDETLDVLAESGLVQGGLHGELPASGDAVAGSAPTGEVLISARDLSYAYPGSSPALQGVSLDVHAGELLAIVGRNGAGKSTLARLLVGLLRPQAGQLTLFGRPAARWRVQELANEIGLVFQNPEHQFLTDSVADEIGYSLLARGISDPAEVKRSTEQVLALLGLQDVAGVHPFALSAGLKRRLGVATMLVGKTRVLVVDEPTYGQDRQMTRTLMALMEEIRLQGIAVMMITHDMRLVQEYAQRVVVMSKGHVLYDGGTAGLFDCPSLLTDANLRLTALQELLAGLRARGVAQAGEIRDTAGFLAALTTKG